MASLVEAELGSRAELHCQAAGVPLPNPMEWSFKGKFISRLEGYNGRLERYNGRLEGYNGRLEGFSGRLDWFDST